VRDKVSRGYKYFTLSWFWEAKKRRFRRLVAVVFGFSIKVEEGRKKVFLLFWIFGVWVRSCKLRTTDGGGKEEGFF